MASGGNVEDDEILEDLINLDVAVDCNGDIIEKDTPPILKTSTREIFHLIANFLDIKSFVRLASTSKKMYKNCMEDERIHIKVEECGIFSDRETKEFELLPVNASKNHIGSYMATLRRLKCNVHMDMFYIEYLVRDPKHLDAAREFLTKLGVKTIYRMKYSSIRNVDIPGFIDDFHVTSFASTAPVPDHMVRALLAKKMRYLAFYSPINIKTLAVEHISVSHLVLTPTSPISIKDLMHNLNRVQKGAVEALVLNDAKIDWKALPCLPYDYDSVLPKSRPLVFTDEERSTNYVLNFNGRVLKCMGNENRIIMIECPSDDYPPASRAELDALEKLGQKYSYLMCSSSMFQLFFKDFPKIDATHKGPLPSDRPLAYRINRNSYILIYPDDRMEQFNFRDSFVRRRFWAIKTNWPQKLEHPVLQKYVFRKMVEEKRNGRFHCGDVENLEMLLDDWNVFPEDYIGALPEERPLVMLTADGAYDILLKDGTTVFCSYEDPFLTLTVRDPLDTSDKILSVAGVSKQLLQSILKKKTMSDSWNSTWYGDVTELPRCFEGYKIISTRDLRGRTPHKLPVVVINRSSKTAFYHFVREDRMIISCLPKEGSIDFSAFRIPRNMARYFLP